MKHNTELGIKIQCPVCGTLLKIWEEIYYNDVGDGDVYKDGDVEYECPNGCLYSDEQIRAIDAEIERKLAEV